MSLITTNTTSSLRFPLCVRLFVCLRVHVTSPASGGRENLSVVSCLCRNPLTALFLQISFVVVTSPHVQGWTLDCSLYYWKTALRWTAPPLFPILHSSVFFFILLALSECLFYHKVLYFNMEGNIKIHLHNSLSY